MQRMSETKANMYLDFILTDNSLIAEPKQEKKS